MPNNELISSYSQTEVDNLLDSFKKDLEEKNLMNFLNKIDEDAEVYCKEWLENYKKVRKNFFIIRFKKKYVFLKQVIFISLFNTADRLFFRRNIARPTFVIWSMLNQCNAKCYFCHDGTPEAENSNYFDKKIPMPSMENAWEAFENLKKNVSGIYFCGGEPLVFPDTLKMVQKAAQSGMWPLFVNTNGMFIGKKLLDEELLAGNPSLKSIDYLVLSVHSLYPEKIANIFKTAGGIYDAVNQLRFIYILKKMQKHLGFVLMTNTVIHEENLDDTYDILDWGVKNDVRMNFVPQFMGKNTRPVIYKNENYIKLANKILERKTRGARVYGDYSMLKKLLLGGNFSCYPTNRIHLKPNENRHYDIPMPCSGDEKLILPVDNFVKQTDIEVTINGKKFNLSTKGKTWLDVIKEMQSNGLKTHCSRGQCYLAQDLSTELIYKSENMVLFGLREAIYSIRRLFLPSKI